MGSGGAGRMVHVFLGPRILQFLVSWMRGGKIKECADCGRPLPTGKFELNRRTCIKCRNIFARYKISGKDFFNMLHDQMFTCLICEDPINENTACVDHCHDDKTVRALLCKRCNIAIGHLRHDAEVAYRSFEYLRKYT